MRQIVEKVSLQSFIGKSVDAKTLDPDLVHDRIAAFATAIKIRMFSSGAIFHFFLISFYFLSFFIGPRSPGPIYVSGLSLSE